MAGKSGPCSREEGSFVFLPAESLEKTGETPAGSLMTGQSQVSSRGLLRHFVPRNDTIIKLNTIQIIANFVIHAEF